MCVKETEISSIITDMVIVSILTDCETVSNVLLHKAQRKEIKAKWGKSEREASDEKRKEKKKKKNSSSSSINSTKDRKECE